MMRDVTSRTSRRRRQKQQPPVWKTIVFVVGFILAGNVCFVFGAVFLLFGLRSLLQMICFRKSWLTNLQKIKETAANAWIPGTIIHQSWSVDPWTGIKTYQLVVKYTIETTTKKCMNENKDNNNGSTVTVLAQTLDPGTSEWMFPHVHVGQHVRLVKIKGKTNDNDPEDAASNTTTVVFPKFCLEYKWDDCYLWAKYFDVGVAFIGIQVYVLGAALSLLFFVGISPMMMEFYAKAPHVTDSTSLLAPLCMIPYLYQELHQRHSERILLAQGRLSPSQLLLHNDNAKNTNTGKDPTRCLHSEWDVIRESITSWLGHQGYRRGLSAILFPIGLIYMYLLPDDDDDDCGLLAVLACVMVWSLTLLSVESSTSSVVPLTPHQCWSCYYNNRSSKPTTDSSMVFPVNVKWHELETLTTYTAPTTTGNNLPPSSRPFTNDFNNVVVHHAELPHAGYPPDQVEHEWRKSACRLKVWQIITTISVTLYALYAWFLFEGRDSILSLFATRVLLGPMLMYPQMMILQRRWNRDRVISILCARPAGKHDEPPIISSEIIT